MNNRAVADQGCMFIALHRIAPSLLQEYTAQITRPVSSLLLVCLLVLICLLLLLVVVVVSLLLHPVSVRRFPSTFAAQDLFGGLGCPGTFFDR